MKKILATTFSVLTLSAVSLVPALADDTCPMKNVALLPVRALGLATSTVVGTPIAAVRMSCKETKSLSEDIGGDNKAKKAVGYLVALPVGVAKGTVQGCYYGPHNAIKNCVDKPFSKDSFSLGDIE